MSGILGIAYPQRRIGAEALSGVFTGTEFADFKYTFNQIEVTPQQLAGRVIFTASNGNSLFGASDTNQPKSIRSLCLIRAYQA